MQRLNQTIADLIKGIEDSVIIHGDWQEYTETDVYIAVAGEFSEYFQAFTSFEVHGEHGQIDELRDLAIVAIA